jgi:hypothetical protein
MRFVGQLRKEEWTISGAYEAIATASEFLSIPVINAASDRAPWSNKRTHTYVQLKEVGEIAVATLQLAHSIQPP